MLKNTCVRIAVILLLLIPLYYLVITLSRGVAGADGAWRPLEGSEPIVVARRRT